MSRNRESANHLRTGFHGIGVHTCPLTLTCLQTRRVWWLKDITAERTCSLGTDLRVYLDSAFERALPMMAETSLTLTPQQIRNIERRYAKINEEFRDDHLQGDESRRLKKSIKRTV